MSVKQVCDECKAVLYDFVNGIAQTQEHKSSCSRYMKKDMGYFNIGDRIRRKKECQDAWWKYGDKIFTVSFVGEKSPEIIMLEKSELDENECNVWEYKKFEKVNVNETI